MNRQKKKIFGAACALSVILAIAIALFFKKTNNAAQSETSGPAEETAGIAVIEYRWGDDSPGEDHSVTIRYAEETGAYYLYDNRCQRCRLKDIHKKKEILHLDSASLQEAADIAACFEEHQEDSIVYRGSYEQAVQAFAWLKNDGAKRLYSVITGEYADIYFGYKGKQYRLLVCDADGSVLVCFAPLEEEIQIPDKDTVISGYEPYGKE